jgi:hypothetical protein
VLERMPMTVDYDSDDSSLPDLEPRTVKYDLDESSDDSCEDLLPGLQDAASMSESEKIKGNDIDHTEQETLAHIEREARERKSTKFDDAEIPAYLWEEHLLQDGPTPWDATTTDIPKLKLGMAMLRRRMLRWWKQRVLDGQKIQITDKE